MKQIACRICGRAFAPPHSSTRLCSPRCVYISNQLSSPPSKRMARDDAIKYYGHLFDDPLRLYLHSRHAPILQHIYDFCMAEGRDTFTCDEINEGSPKRITHQKLAQIRRQLNLLTHQTDTAPTTWTFVLPDLVI